MSASDRFHQAPNVPRPVNLMNETQGYRTSSCVLKEVAADCCNIDPYEHKGILHYDFANVLMCEG